MIPIGTLRFLPSNFERKIGDRPECFLARKRPARPRFTPLFPVYSNQQFARKTNRVGSGELPPKIVVMDVEDALWAPTNL
jgi:hypothetical protein